MRALVAVAVILLSACAAQPKPAPSGGAPAPVLYDALGGQAAVEQLVDATLAFVHDDKRINALFKRTDLKELRRLLVEQFCEVTGGPCVYSGRSMEEAHSGLAITHAEFGYFVEDLSRAMRQLKVSAANQQRLLALLGPMEPQIVGQ